MYPIKKREFFIGTRGELTIELELCIFCGLCQKKCPTDAIEVHKQVTGWKDETKSWQVEKSKCISCGCCVEICPKKCLHLNTKYTASRVADEKSGFSEVLRRA